jgi:hypothetical protein
MDGLDSQPSSLTSAVERVLASSQRVFVDRIDLLRLEAREDVATAVRGGIFVLGGTILLFYGWIIVVAWVVYMLWGALPLGATIGAAAAFHVVGGTILGWLGARILAGIRLMRPDDPEVARREQQALKAGIKGAA